MLPPPLNVVLPSPAYLIQFSLERLSLVRSITLTKKIESDSVRMYIIFFAEQRDHMNGIMSHLTLRCSLKYHYVLKGGNFGRYETCSIEHGWHGHGVPGQTGRKNICRPGCRYA